MRNTQYLILILAILAGCSKGSNNHNGGGNTPAPAPGRAALSAPAQNSSCTPEQVLSTGESTISFSWESSSNTKSYELVIHNLQSSWDTTVQASQTQASVRLARSAAYSWYVVSLSNATSDTVHSLAWKFYNPGPGATTYAPFPAELTSPGYGQQIGTAGTISLAWVGSSVNSETLTYDVYLGTSAQQLVLYQNKVKTMSLSVTVQSNTTYYWQVVSKA